MTRPILIKIKHIYGATKSSLPVPDRHLTQRCRCCVSAAFRSACSLAWRKISYAAVLAKKMLLLTTLVNIGANESAATARRASEREREGAAAACDERRCCCPPATAAAVKCCKAVAPCWCSWRPTVLPEFQNFQQKPD